MEFRDILLRKCLGAEEDWNLMAGLKNVPLIISGVSASKDNPVTVEIIRGKEFGRRGYNLQPCRGMQIRCFLDSYVVNKGGIKLPNLASFIPGNANDPRSYFETEVMVGSDPYVLNIFLEAKKD